MIEEALRRQLQPIADRRRRLHLAQRLSICWLVCALVGTSLLGAPFVVTPQGVSWNALAGTLQTALCVAAVVATGWIIRRSRRLQPDYRALARTIEQQHPDLQALLLAAIEQEPQGPDGQMGFLQQRVITEAVTHATGPDWLQSISTGRLMLAGLGWVVALLFLIAVLSQMLPLTSLLPRDHKGVLASKDSGVAVSPGNTSVEQGSPVVILARFEGRVPSSVALLFGEAGKEPQRIALSRSLDDPVFGGILQDVRSDLVYHVEYAGWRTHDYTISVYQCPELVRADAKVVYPIYTQLPQKTIKDTRQVSVVEGSEVTLFFTLNKPVTSARLVPKSGIALGLTVDRQDPNVLITSVTASQSQRYELQLTDAQGRSNKLPPRFAIDVHKNLPPELMPVFPGSDVAVSPLEELSLEAKVADDYGVTAYGISYALAGTQGQDVSLTTADSTNGDNPQSAIHNPQSGTGAQIRYLLAMEELKAQPDQLLTWYYWAEDVGPDGRSRRTASDIYFAEVRPFEEIFRESGSFQDQQNQDQQNQSGNQQDRLGERLAQLQKQIIIATWNIKQQAERAGELGSRKEDLDVVRQSQAGAIEQAGEASKEAEDPAAMKALQAASGHMETALDHLTKASESASTAELTPALSDEQSAYQELLKLRQREHQVAQGRNSNRAASANSQRFQQQLQQLQLTQRENRYETQRLAQSREQAGRSEDLQMLNRLRDLARRQNEMSDRLREAQAALRQAQTEQQRQEALRELRRLRDEQLEALRDTDELQQQMESPQNRQRMADARQRLDDSRSGIRESAEAMEQGMISRAITSATRAQRQLEQMRDEFQRRTSSQFSDQMRTMREEAQQLDQREEKISQELGQQLDARQKTLAGPDANRELSDRVDQQREDMKKLVDQMKEVSEQAENSEPLLSRTLYDTLREASTENLDKSLEMTRELLRRDLLPQAQELEHRAGNGIDEIRKGVEEAARNVLGDEADSLRLARQQIEELVRQVNDEMTRSGGARPQAGEPNESTDSASQRQQANAQSGARKGRQGEQSADQRPRAADDGRSERARQGASPREGEPARASSDSPQQAAGRGGRANPTGRGGTPGVPGQWEDAGNRGPFVGEDFRQWSDGLRNVEEMLTEQELRDEAARIQDRARAIRAEFKRHGTEPQWDLVRSQIADPLTELWQRVEKKLAQLQSNESLAPIDRDPVPDRFADLVRAYFESLGQEEGPGN
jgi:hypothetical protein